MYATCIVPAGYGDSGTSTGGWAGSEPVVTQLVGSAHEMELELRIVKGLSLELDGEIARVRDQLYLSGAGLTRDDVLLQQRALATSYEYFSRVGLSYTFGSIYNTVVNPRLNAIENAQ